MAHRILSMARCCFAVWLSAGACSLWAQEDDPALRERFLTGISQTARKLEALSFRAQCQYTSVNKGTEAAGKIDARHYEIAIRGAYGLETGRNKNTGTVFFRVRNGSYAFALDRSAKGERTSLQFVEEVGIDPSIDAEIAKREEVPRAMALAGYYLWTEPLYRVVQSDSFSIKRTYHVTSGTNELVRIEFEYLLDDPAREMKERFTDGFLVCDPARQWALTECGATHYNFINKYTAVLTRALEYGEAIGEMPIATKITQTARSPDDKYQRESVITLQITGRDVPEEEFYLTHYGLPEPNFGRNWFGTWGWYLSGGILCIVIGMLLIRRRKAGR